MAELGPVLWPPVPIQTERLVLRAAEAGDRSGIIELLASPEVGVFVGGARPRGELEGSVPEVPGQRPGFFVVERGGALIGTVTLDRNQEGHADLGYLFLPSAWGHGYAVEACAAALDWCAAARPGERVVVTTQTANVPSMRVADKLGFAEVERFEEYGAEQWSGVWSPASRRGHAASGSPATPRAPQA
jgi:RimJ/RimL family protein N-acetyltransferase